MSFRDNDVSLRFNNRQTDGAAEHGDFTHILDAVENGADGALLALQHYILGGQLTSNPELSQKTTEKIARTFFAQPESKLTGTFASVLSSSLAWTGRMSELTALEIFVSLLFGMLISDDTVESELGMNLIREGVKKKKEFRKVICGRGGLLGRSALILTLSTSSSLNMITPLHVQLNVIELLLDLAKGKVSIWDTSDSELLLDALQLNIEEEKEKEDDDKDDDDNDEDRLKENIKSLLLLLDLKGLKKKSQISNDERKEFEDRIRITEERVRIVEEQKRIEEDIRRKAEEQKRIAEKRQRNAEEGKRSAEEQVTRLQIEKETQLNNLIHQTGQSGITFAQWTELAKEMKKPFGINEQENKQIEESIEEICEMIGDTFKDKEDERGRKNSIQSGLAESLILIFTQWPLDKIMEVHSKAFLYLTVPSGNQITLLLFEKKPFAGLLRLLDHTDRYVVGNAIASIHNIIIRGFDTTRISEPHPHYPAMAELGGIEKTFELFNRNLGTYSRDTSAICIGSLFRAREISNKKMRQKVIKHLKQLANGPEGYEKNAAKQTLKSLAQNAVNRTEIEKDGFVIPK